MAYHTIIAKGSVCVCGFITSVVDSFHIILHDPNYSICAKFSTAKAAAGESHDEAKKMLCVLLCTTALKFVRFHLVYLSLVSSCSSSIVTLAVEEVFHTPYTNIQ